MDVLARLDQTRAANSILEHPFYRRWSAGELGAPELSCYAGEYRHAVIALAQASALAETQACVHSWTQGEDLLEHLAVLYAIEASQPDVARTKLDGLTCHYGYSSEGPAVEYFTTHERRDVEHARQGAALIERLIAAEQAPREKADSMVRRAEEALHGNQVLLDGVEGCARR
jgi:pyrroloquinoline quinone (PQQ) biosynthesis protein C